MILEIDLGNTRLKWRLRHDDKVCSSGAMMTSGALEELGYVLSDLDVSMIAAVYISSVVSRLQPLLKDLILRHCSVEPRFAETTRYCAGVTNAYSDVSQMGVDRWLALLATFKRQCGDFLVVDAGSAVTIDLLSLSGSHVGGYIVPGLQLMKASLLTTDQVVVGSSEYPEKSVPGVSTMRGVLAGLPLMIESFIYGVYQQFGKTLTSTPSIMLTGGDGCYMADRLRDRGVDQVLFEPDLVLDGLDVLISTKDYS